MVCMEKQESKTHAMAKINTKKKKQSLLPYVLVIVKNLSNGIEGDGIDLYMDMEAGAKISLKSLKSPRYVHVDVGDL